MDCEVFHGNKFQSECSLSFLVFFFFYLKLCLKSENHWTLYLSSACAFNQLLSKQVIQLFSLVEKPVNKCTQKEEMWSFSLFQSLFSVPGVKCLGLSLEPSKSSKVSMDQGGAAWCPVHPLPLCSVPQVLVTQFSTE